MTRLIPLAKQFIRKYNLTLIGETKTKVIEDLRIVFEVSKSLRSFPNLAKIDIYNPNDDTVAFINGEDPLVLLSAGYSGNVGLIFKGKLNNVFVNKQSEDRIVTMYAADGGRNWQQGTFNKTLSETIPINDVVKQLFDTLTDHEDIAIGPIQGLDLPADKLLGQTLSGSSKDILDMLAEDYNFTWSIQDGELIAVQGTRSVLGSVSTATLIKQSTGMIGSPTLTQIGADATSLLNPDLLPNSLFIIESDSAEIAVTGVQFLKVKRTIGEGKYRAFEVLHVGDTHGGQWVTTVKGDIPGNV